MVMMPQSSGVAHQHPAVESRLAAAEEVVAGKDGDGRNGGQNVAGQLGLGEGEKDDGNERPEHQELRKGVAGAAGAGLALAGVAQAPLGHRGRMPSTRARMAMTVQGIMASTTTTR